MNDLSTELNLFHEDNIVRFLNEVSFAEEIITTLGLEPRAEFLETASRILEVRDNLGAFFNLYDVGTALDFNTELGKTILDAARHPLFMGPAVERVGSLGLSANPAFAASTMLAPVLLPGGVLFSIVWAGEPQEWVRPLMRLMIETSAKRLGIELKLAEAEKAVADAERQLRVLGTQTNPDPGVVASAKGKLTSAKKQVKEVEREADALNKLVKKKDHKGVWAIVKRNIEAEIKALRQRASAMPTTTLQEARARQRVIDSAERKEREIQRVDQEVAGYRPPP